MRKTRHVAARRGSFFVVAGPSGSGKTTLLADVRRRMPDLIYSPSYTSRALRPGETPSQNYHFLSRTDFEQMIERDEFLEWAIYNGNYYGMSRHHVQSFLRQGKNVIKEIEVQGMKQLNKKRRAIGGELVSIFILPPSLAELKRRLSNRGTESQAKLRQRLKTAQTELKAVELFDYLLINRDQTQASDALARLISWHSA